MAADLKGNEKSSRVMMFFNQEFVERKMDFKPKKALNREEFTDEVRKIFPESLLLENMIKLEEDIDESLYNYRLKIQEKLIKPNFKIEAILRTQILFNMYYSNINEDTLEETRSIFTSEDLSKHLSSIKSIESDSDMFDIYQENTPSEIYWTLRFQGKIIYNSEMNVPENNSFRKFTYFFNKVIFKFESIEGTPPLEDIEWNRNSNDTDGFEIKRPIIIGIPKKVKIYYFLNNFSQKYSIINQDLANLIGVSKDTRPRILYYIWQYIKLNSLQDKENNNLVLNNKSLIKIFKVERMDITSLPNRLINLIKPLDQIENIIEVELNNSSIIDIPVHIDDPNFISITHLLSNIETESLLFPKSLFNIKDQNKPEKQVIDKFYSQINDYDRQVSELFEKFNKYKSNYDFFSEYSKDPTKFINNFLVQQESLVKILKNEASVIDTRFDYGSFNFYKDYEDVLQDSITNYLKMKRKLNN